MKKFLVIVFAVTALASCTKDYTCECTDPATSEVSQMLYKTNSKTHAVRLCDDWATRTRTAIP